ncbi:hypothetical protein JRQ81_016368 [Phrynocephalus forsythii]|uniref:C-type lectin domain-containing protein n=1 Tax=Phrynocephalus forsythii TaxID=171643 RepID=A0A9Q0XSQ6_9SAUR|nr:hypothetical protein JRQ81_016368 [Phrynocephalus forsythii]
MAREISYENAEVFEPKDMALKKSSQKRTTFLVSFLAAFSLLLAISLLAVAVLYVRLLENISEAFSKLQAHLENVNASKMRPRTVIFGVQNAFFVPKGNLLQLVSAGWRLYQGQFYLLSQESKTWHAAEQACWASGAHLTSVTSRQEMDYLSKESRGETFWIGLSDQGKEGTWTWVDGTKYNRDVSFWAQGQPDNWHGAPGHREDCVHVAKGQWNDISCTYSYRSFCKKAAFS